MSNHDHSDFFRDRTNIGDTPGTSFAAYLATLNDNQFRALENFYTSFCDPGAGQDFTHPDGRVFNRDDVTYGRTKHNVFFALHVLDSPHYPTASDYSLQTLQKKGDEMLLEEYKVHAVKHVLRPAPFDTGMDRLVYADGSKRIALELGRRTFWIETIIVEDQEIELPFPVEQFSIPSTTPGGM